MSLLVLSTMFVMLGASVWVFAELVSRQTRHRKRVSLAQWARSRQLRVLDPDSVDPALALPPLANLEPKLTSLIRGESLTFAQVQTNDSKSAMVTPAGGRSSWNILQSTMPHDWPPCGLRPTSGAKSFIDLFGFSSFPSLALDRRFMVFGNESRCAAALVASGVLSRLPSEVGLLLHGRYLILDFSSRPFDEIELARIVELSQELTTLLAPARR